MEAMSLEELPTQKDISDIWNRQVTLVLPTFLRLMIMSENIRGSSWSQFSAVDINSRSRRRLVIRIYTLVSSTQAGNTKRASRIEPAKNKKTIAKRKVMRVSQRGITSARDQIVPIESIYTPEIRKI